MLALREELEALRGQVCLAVDFPEEDVECLAPEAFAQAVSRVALAVRQLLAGQRRPGSCSRALWWFWPER